MCGLNTYRGRTYDQFRAVCRCNLTYQVDDLLRANPIVLSQRSSRGYHKMFRELGESELRRLPRHMICEHVRVYH